MSWLSRYIKDRRFNLSKIKDLENNLITIYRLNQLKDEHLLLKDEQLTLKQEELDDILIKKYAILATIVLAHSGEYIIDKTLFDIVTSAAYDKNLHVENLADGSSKLTLINRVNTEVMDTSGVFSTEDMSDFTIPEK